MSDQSGHPRWSPPGDATEEPPPPPPPPPPPEAGAGVPSYGSGGWEPPKKRRRTGVIVAIVVAVVAVPLVLGALALVAVRTTEGPTPGTQEDTEVTTEPPTAVPEGDETAQAEAVLETIDESEERMLAFQRDVFAAIGEDGNVGDAAEEVAAVARSAGDDLTELRSGLRSLAEEGDGETFDVLREVRASYAEHMTAWIDYVDAVGGNPALAAPQSPDSEPFMEEINVSGEVFVEAVEDLPEDLPDRLLDLADMIVERGFSSGGDSPGNLV